MEGQGVIAHNQAMDDITRIRTMLIGGVEAMLHDFAFTEVLMSHCIAAKTAQAKEAYKVAITTRLDEHKALIEGAFERLEKLEDLISHL